MSLTNTAIVGGGIAGLSVAYRLARIGHKITVIDPNPGLGATHAAAGMLAPASEVNFSEIELLQFMQHSNQLWPEFASLIEADSNISVGYRTEGTIVTGYDPSDALELERISEFQKEFGIEVSRLSRSDLRELEPALTSPLSFAALISSDRQVNNRLLVQGLVGALKKYHVEFVRKTVSAISPNRTNEFQITLGDGEVLSPEVIVLAPGAQLEEISGLPQVLYNTVRPVKGQIIRVDSPRSNMITHVIRALVESKGVYLVPRKDREIVIGATQEEVGFNNTARIRPIAEMLTNSITVVPEIGEADFREHLVRFRPGSIDNYPIVGQFGTSNLFLSLGHFRHGILISAAVSKHLATLIDSGKIPSEIAPFGIDRFSGS